ncbi:succinylglutamate desuccinylase/aspartoacylase family protein [Nitrospina gracilis]|uniref:succinylglutamate desuccinylase/aspartoacylase family protein n=1 Tax=Nitrospina gracilis TaxID=35801 RepID=UPI001F00439E|nr:putative deacylase [Nitrospina gracilis Nb-211]
MKQEIFSSPTPLGDTLTLYKNLWKGPEDGQTLSIVAGIQGDRLNGVLAAGRIAKFLQSVADGNEPGLKLSGTVQVFPVVNHRALESGSATWSYDNLDADLAFPGSEEGDLTETLCNRLLHETAGSDYGIILQTGSTHFEDAPHVRAYRPSLTMRKASRRFNLAVIREVPDIPSVNLQLSRQWHDMDIQTFTLSAGRPQVCDPSAIDALYKSVVHFLREMEFISCENEEDATMTEAMFYKSKNEVWVNTKQAGLYLPCGKVGVTVEAGQKLGEVFDLYGGQLLETVIAPQAGYLVSQRVHPMAHEQEPVAILLSGGHSKWFWPF